MKEFDLHTNRIKSGFEIPDNYFEKFENELMEKVATKAEPKVVSLFYRKQVWISAIAAVFVALFAIPFYFNSVSSSNLETATLENYLTTEFNTYDLVDKLTEEDIVALEGEVSLSNEAIEDYLLETQNLNYYLNE